MPTSTVLYVDGSDALEEGVWRLSDQHVMPFVAWPQSGGEPDGGTAQNCLVVVSTSPYEVHDYACTRMQHNQHVYAVCEHEGKVARR